MADTLQYLLARVEAATRPDREIDAELSAVLRVAPDNIGKIWMHSLQPNSPEIGRVICSTNLGTEGPWFHAPPYTASFDASLALTERVLPGWHWGVHCHKGAFRAHVTKPSPLRPMPNIGDALKPALALLAALLRAKMESAHDRD